MGALSAPKPTMNASDRPIGRARRKSPVGAATVPAVPALFWPHGAADAVADAQKQRPERLGLLLGDAAGGLIQHQQRRVLGQDAREIDDAARPGRQLAGELLLEGAEAH